MSNPSLIPIRFTGENMRPAAMRSADLATLVESVEILVFSIAQDEQPELSKDELWIGLVDLSDGSLSLGFQPSIPKPAFAAYHRLTRLLHAQNFDRIPYAAKQALKSIVGVAKRYRCLLEFRDPTDGQILSSIDAALEIPAAALIHTQTTLYGRVISTGGKQPNAHIELPTGEVVVCSGNEQQIRDLAQRLYQWAAVEGEGRVAVDSLEFEDFKIHNILPYRDTPIGDAMAELADAVGDRFDDVDPIAYVRRLRDDE